VSYYDLAELTAIADVVERYDVDSRAAQEFLSQVGYLGDDRPAS
jgi:hypothetical protein